MRKEKLLLFIYLISNIAFAQSINKDKNESVVTKTKIESKLRTTTSIFSETILKIPENSEILLLEYTSDFYWRVKYHEKIGFISDFDFFRTKESEAFKKKFTNRYLEEKDKQRRKDSIENVFLELEDIRDKAIQDSINIKEKRKKREWLAYMHTNDSFNRNNADIVSTDGRVKIKSERLAGGSWHPYSSYAQYKTENNTINIKYISGDCFRESCYTDVMNYEIHDINIDGKNHYLVIGKGTHGSGNHHKIIQSFRIENDDFIKDRGLFNGKDEIVIVLSRSTPININYNNKTNELVFDEAIENVQYDSMQLTGNKTVLKLKRGKFISYDTL